MNRPAQSGVLRAALLTGFGLFVASVANAQIPVVPVVVDTAAPIVVQTLKPHKGPQPPKFEGTVVNATNTQITVRDKNNSMAIQTFPLTPELSAKMNQLMEKGGYQYGDKVTVFYDPDSKKAIRIKGKPSKS
ncbi:MAG TPA: hypothetical protein VMT51_04080 [Dongiaceae bacterium]|nr:hypothetical protein [Dongiaceae bacterium]